MILVGDCREMLATLPERSVQTCITSPPYFGLRDYGTGEWDGGDPACDHTRQSVVSRASSGLGVKDGRGPYGDQFAATQGGTIAYASVCGKCGARRVDRQIGLEPTPDEFVAALVDVFRAVRRVLRDDGTVFVERTAMVVRPTPKREAWQAEDDHARTQTGGTMTEPPTSRTVGWESTCTHDDDTGRSTILDPFAGAGTVGVVCGWHGRDFIGIELNPAYADMARERIALEGRPGGPPNGHQASADVAGQASIFDLLGGEAA